MLKFTTHTSKDFEAVIGELTFRKEPFYRRSHKILFTDKAGLDGLGYLALLSEKVPKDSLFLPQMAGEISRQDKDSLNQGDIISVTGAGEVSVLWTALSNHNCLLLTEACNCRCLMCPQPPKERDERLFKIASMVLDLLKGKNVETICLTGGEPTLFEDNFLKILERCLIEQPNAHVSVLTNAKKFIDKGLVKEIAALNNGQVIFCVSMHSDIAQIHDKIVGAPGSYAKTQEGLYNLAQYKIPIEIRYVINKLNYTRINEFALHMYRYFPFCIHYALMSMEICGLAIDNLDSIYVDPIDYKIELRNAVLALTKRGLNVSVYNTPICLCHEDIHKYSRKSISTWKNNYLSQCRVCQEKENCCGFFSTSAIHSRAISPVM
ncbi:MAG: His-Xaa-Ser system radical SAM maturase HxsC [Deltaproteobacteria bacterium]|jgi:His-Xaa-Ser system radical SAM maturase HxsC|nr:His-Xaa-Ser system radical SAM maturase HxsC [Deltaproteobacteria bacterium]